MSLFIYEFRFGFSIKFACRKKSFHSASVVFARKCTVLLVPYNAGEIGVYLPTAANVHSIGLTRRLQCKRAGMQTSISAYLGQARQTDGDEA